MYRGKVDIILGSSIVILIMLGQLMVFSASSMWANLVYGSLTYFFQKQLLWGGLAILLIIVVSKFDFLCVYCLEFYHVYSSLFSKPNFS